MMRLTPSGSFQLIAKTKTKASNVAIANTQAQPPTIKLQMCKVRDFIKILLKNSLR
ncbi:unnamed protein product [marine sediment metagenome]|uniref:Uncharacterized protein n=1 Tax=marine sediment metagenome TaxID=412755 RepID=X0UP20_9ZZZZ